MAKKKIIKKLKNKYRLIIYNDATLAEKLSIKLSLFNTYVIVAGIILLLLFLAIILVRYTPIGYLTESGNYRLKSQLYKNTLQIDSLEKIQRAQNAQYQRIKLVLSGQDSLLSLSSSVVVPSGNKFQNEDKEINYVKSSADSLLRKMVEEEDRFNVTHKNKTEKQALLSLYLYPPVKNGIIVANYENSKSNKFGVDISTTKNTQIMATAEGTVISTNWSPENGYSILIQHEDNLISSYSQATELLKKVGDSVPRGEAIAFLGDKNSPSTVLHFELWHNGNPLVPQDFISF